MSNYIIIRCKWNGRVMSNYIIIRYAPKKDGKQVANVSAVHVVMTLTVLEARYVRFLALFLCLYGTSLSIRLSVRKEMRFSKEMASLGSFWQCNLQRCSGRVCRDQCRRDIECGSRQVCLALTALSVLSDPGIPGVQSMGPSVCNWVLLLMQMPPWHMVANFATDASAAIWWPNL